MLPSSEETRQRPWFYFIFQMRIAYADGKLTDRRNPLFGSPIASALPILVPNAAEALFESPSRALFPVGFGEGPWQCDTEAHL